MQGRPPPRVYSVAQLNQKIVQKLDRWGEVWVEGEVSDVTEAASGHVYFTLNDSVRPAQLRLVMFSGDARRRRARLSEGERVRVRGGFTLYEPRGSFQLVARVALPAGEGDRREQLERLKKKLHAEGLFDPARKRRLPRVPSVIGLVTSRAGAAWRDVVRVARGRAPVRLVLSDCRVQGPDAPSTIVAALRRIAKVPGIEVVILTRGGGASDDLGAFNDERVARAVAACPVPVVSGVGHEVDDTIADLVADVRAATPSNAAELVVPERDALVAELQAMHRRMERALERDLGSQRLALERLARQLRDPRRAAHAARRSLDQARGRLLDGARASLRDAHARLRALEARLHRQAPGARLAAQRARFDALAQRLARVGPTLGATERRALEAATGRLLQVTRARLERERSGLGARVARLDALSPLAVLGRGYAIALKDGRALVRAGDARAGDRLVLRLAEGRLEAEVVASSGAASPAAPEEP